MTRPLAATLLCLIVPAVWALMWLGWRHRGRLQTDLPEPATPQDLAPGADDEAAFPHVYEGVYVSTTRSGEWLERIVAHGLGTRSPVTVRLGDTGLLLERAGGRDIAVPRRDLLGAGTARGIAGKVVERDGIALITWRLGDHRLDSGVRLRHPQDTARLVEQITALVGKVEA